MAAIVCMGQMANSSGVPYSGATVDVFLADTSTRATVYSDATLNVETTNPVVADSLGAVKFYIDSTVAQDFVVKTSGGTTLQEATEVTSSGRNFIPMFSFGAAETLTPISSNITTVAGIAGHVTTVAGDRLAIIQVAADTTAINYIYTNRSMLEDLTGAYSNPETVAAMLSVSEGTLADGKAYYPRGYDAEFDGGGGGPWVWDTSGTYSANGYTVKEHDTATGGVFVLMHDGTVKAETVGIIPDYDSGTDDGTDWSAELEALLAISDVEKVVCGIGSWYLGDGVTKPSGKELVGLSRVLTQFVYNSSSSLVADGMIIFEDTEPSGGLHNIWLHAVQDTTETVRANLVDYPPAIYANDAPRGTISNIRISGFLDGVDLGGNSGGFSFEGVIECGAFRKGLIVDGSLDFIHVDQWHNWPFGVAGTAVATNVWYDGTTVALDIGECDNFDAQSITVFRSIVQFTNTSAANIVDQIGNLALDGNGSRLLLSGSQPRVQIGNLYSTKSTGDVGPAISSSAGYLLINSLHAIANDEKIIEVAGGHVQVDSGFLNQIDTATEFATISSGRLTVKTFCAVPSGARSAHIFAQTGGTMHLDVILSQTGAASSYGISFATDAENTLRGYVGGWGIDLPSSIQNGSYGPVAHDGIDWTPALTFATVGDFSPTYDGATGGKYWLTENGIKGHGRILMDTNAYTTASGAAQVNIPLITSFGDDDTAPVVVGRVRNVTFDSGYTSIVGRLRKSDDTIGFDQIGDGVAHLACDTDNITASTSDIELTFSFEFSVR